jgi:hypothetical protein
MPLFPADSQGVLRPADRLVISAQLPVRVGQQGPSETVCPVIVDRVHQLKSALHVGSAFLQAAEFAIEQAQVGHNAPADLGIHPSIERQRLLEMSNDFQGPRSQPGPAQLPPRQPAR